MSQETLLIFLRSLLVQTVLKWSQNGSQHPRFNQDELLAVPVPITVGKISAHVEKLVNKSLDAQAEAKRLLNAAKAEIEKMILKGEA